MSVLESVHRHFVRCPSSRDLAFLVVIDEARHLCDVSRESSDFDANRNVESFYTESRGAGIGRATFSQEPSSLPSFVTGNSRYVASFRLEGDELTNSAMALSLTDSQRESFHSLPITGSCVFRHPLLERAFRVDVRSDSGLLPGVSPLDVRRHMRPFVDDLHESIKKLNDSVVSVRGESDDVDVPDDAPIVDGLSSDEWQVLQELKKDCFLYFSLLNQQVPGVSDLGKVVSSLSKKGFLVPKKLSGKTRDRTYFPLTEKAHAVLKVPVKDRVQPPFFEHTLFCRHVLGWLRGRGEDAALEYSLKGVPGRIDVYSRTTNTAFEVQLSDKNAVANAEKCLEVFGCKKLFFVCRNNAHARRFKTKVLVWRRALTSRRRGAALSSLSVSKNFFDDEEEPCFMTLLTRTWLTRSTK